jgi:hypothetical protein
LLTAPPPRPHAALTNLAANMEIAAARLRKTGRKEFTSLANLEAALDAILLETDNSSILPTSSHVPSSSRWQDALQAMMPNRKPGQKHCESVADKAYGAGASSGRKAKESGERKRARLRYMHCSFAVNQPTNRQSNSPESPPHMAMPPSTAPVSRPAPPPSPPAFSATQPTRQTRCKVPAPPQPTPSNLNTSFKFVAYVPPQYK